MPDFEVRVELAPFPDLEGPASDYVSFSASFVIAGAPESATFDQRVTQTATAAGTDVPPTPDGDWTSIENAFATHLAELLPWLWTYVAFELYGPFGQADGTSYLVPTPATLSAQSVDAVRRAILAGIHRNALHPLVPELLRFRVATLEDSAITRFHFPSLMAQSAEWPAPVPHLALGNVFLFRVPRKTVEALGTTGTLFAVPRFSAGGFHFVETNVSPGAKEATWQYAKNSDTHYIEGRGIGVDLAKLLDKNPWTPGSGAGSFCDPYKQLWLGDDAVDQSASTVAATDWQSRLPAELESAAETPQRMLEWLRGDVAAGGSRLSPDTFRQVIGALRDVVGPGVVCDKSGLYHRIGADRSLDAAPAVKLATECRPDEWPDVPPIDLWEEIGDGSGAPTGHAEDELERLAMLRRLVTVERNAPESYDSWHGVLRTALPELAEWLPPTGDLDAVLGAEPPSARLDRLEAIYRIATDPPRHAALVVAQWRNAVERVPADADVPRARAFLAKWEHKLAALVRERELMVEMRRAAALDLAADVARRTGAFRDRIRDALIAHSTARFAAGSILKPVLPGTRPEQLDAVFEDASQEIAETLGLDRKVDPRLEPTPSPLFVQVDTLHDDSEYDNGEIDINAWLRGYSAILRWRNHSAETGAWSCPHLGEIEVPWWSNPGAPYILTAADERTPAPALGSHVVAATHGMRQVGIHLDDRAWLVALEASDLEGDSELGGDPGAAFLRAVSRYTGADPSGVPGTVPPLGFGLLYDVVPFAIGASSALPAELTDGTTPHIFAPVAGWEGQLPSAREARYLRRVGVNAVHVDYSARGDARAPGPFDIPADIPVAARAVDAEAHLDPTSEARTRAPAPPLLVLLSKEGFASAPALAPGSDVARFALEAPDCSALVYRRWCTGVRFRGAAGDRAAWKLWLERIDAADDARQRLAGDAKLREELGYAEKALPRLHDPAVSAIRVRWTPLRAERADPDEILLPLSRAETLPLTPATIGAGTAAARTAKLLGELERTNFARWTIEISVATDAAQPRFEPPAAGASVLKVRLRPGEIGELRYSPAVAAKEFDESTGTFDPKAFEPGALEPFKSGGEDFLLFPPQRTRVEVATGHSPSPETLYHHVRARAEIRANTDVHVVLLRFDRDAFAHPATGVLPLPADPGQRAQLLAFDNLASLRARWQAWRPAGKPQAGFPATQLDLDERPSFDDADASLHAIAWDAEGFGERSESAGTLEGERRLGLREVVAEVFAHEPGDATPRYLRMEVTASHRNAALYRKAGAVGALPDVVARSPGTGADELWTSWRRALRPGRRGTPIDSPAVKLVVPLARPIDSTGRHSSDLLVVLNEQWHLRGGLGESLECAIEPAIRGRAGAPLPRPEFGPDPILSGSGGPESGIVSLPARGPLGHTFDTDSREPLFSATSFVLRTSELLDPFDMAKLAFRRVLLPEFMEGYFDVPEIDPSKSLVHRYDRIAGAPGRKPFVPGAKLIAVGEGLVSVDGISFPRAAGGGEVDCSDAFTVRFGGGPIAWRSSLEKKVSGDRRTYSIRRLDTLDGLVQGDFAVEVVGTVPPGSGEVSLRVVAKRIREASPNSNDPKKARWEVALYARTRGLTSGALAQWERLATWRGDEPDGLDSEAAGLAIDPPGAAAGWAHVAALAAHRHSAYTPAEWAQVMPDADKAPINRMPWCGLTETPAAFAVARGVAPGRLALERRDGAATQLTWQPTPIAAGLEGQGLFHLGLVTRVVMTGDGAESEAFVDLFTGTPSGVLKPTRLAEGDLPKAIGKSRLRAYVLLVQQDLHRRDDAGNPVPFEKLLADYWEESFRSDTANGGHPQDATFRILSISSPIEQDGVSSVSH